MAFNDPNSLTKQTIDDTMPLTCIIDAAQKSGDHIEYMLRVQRGRTPDNCWQMVKRYSDFVALDSTLKESSIELTLPPKKLLGNFDREFVSERQKGLQTYMDTVLSHPLLANSMPVKQFLDEKNYSPDIPKVANQHVSMEFRSQPGWVSEGVINSLGWRVRKSFFPVKQLNGGKPHGSFLLEWIEYGPDRCIPDKEMSGLMNVLPTISHPNIFPVVHATATEYGGIVIRPVTEKGSVRDVACKCKPRGGTFLKKYGNHKNVSPFPVPTIKAFGRQILETLNFLKEKKFPYGHLHPGNVLVKDNNCYLSDIENSILGLPSLYRSFLIDFRKIQTTEMVDIYGFGHVVYTMVFGRELTTPTCDSFPPECPAQLRSVLESILTTEACKNGLPTIENLLSHPFFVDAPPLTVTDRPQLKVPSKLKESVRQAREAVEARLKDDQTLVYQIKRRSRAKQFHFSEEEKKKRQKSRKKAMENGSSDSSSAPAASAPTSPSQSSQASSSSSASQPAASSASPAGKP